MQLQTGSVSRRKLSRWSLLISIPLAAALFYWSARGVEWLRVWEAVSHARMGYLWCSAAITTCTYGLRALRWRILLNAEGRLGVGLVFRANMVGYLGNNFLPARAGEVLRSVMIGRASELSNTYVLTTALAERLVDVIAVVLAGALALLGITPKPVWVTDVSRTLLILAGGGALALIVLPHAGGIVEKILLGIPLPQGARRFLMTTAEQVLRGLRAFHDWGRLAGFAAFTAVIWSGDGLGVVAAGRALHVTVPYAGAILLLAAMGLGSALPSTPGYIGIYQFAAVLVLTPLGITKDEALALSVLIQAMGFVVVAALGLPAAYWGPGTRKKEDSAISQNALC